MSSRLVTLALLGGICLAPAACTPTYPNCKNDGHCKEGEFCVRGLCQQCRDNEDCRAGEQCNQGRCENVEGYCETTADCPDGRACVNNRCVACKSDSDCGEGGRCRNGRCLTTGQCATDDDCPENHECQDGNCVAPPVDASQGPCQPQPIFFGFDEFVLSAQATTKLRAAAQCIKSNPGRRMRVEGHCDPRGTEEYNLALGDRRARSVAKYLSRLGVKGGRLRGVSKGKLEATGTNEASWAQDRKVVFFWE